MTPTFTPTGHNDTVAVPAGDLTLWQAVRFAADGEDYWAKTMPLILQTFGIPFDRYWDLTVDEHAAMVAHAEKET